MIALARQKTVGDILAELLTAPLARAYDTSVRNAPIPERVP
jgi:hypothetical protein